LFDLQLVPRDDEVQGSTTSFLEGTSTLEDRIDDFLSQCSCLCTLLKSKHNNAFWTTKNNSNNNSSNQNNNNNDIDFSLSILKGCTEQFDPELLKCQLLDWFAIVQRQQRVLRETSTLAEQIRQAEMKMSIAGASVQSIKLVKERLEKIQSDRQQRLEVLKDMVQELCVREMNLYVNVQGPSATQSLVLPKTSAVGFLGIPLLLAGETLPVG
jgi:hypothetical protein